MPGLKRRKSDKTKLSLSTYLNKAISTLNPLIAINATHNCSVYSPVHVTELPAWQSSDRECSDATHMLGQAAVEKMVNKCPSRYFQCDDGTCIIQHYRCDSEADCPDASDENCNSVTCSSQEYSTFICPNNCVIQNLVCGFLFILCADFSCRPISMGCEITTSIEYRQQNQNSGFEIMSTDLACTYDRNFHPEDNDLFNAPHLEWCYLHECPGMYKCFESYCIPYHYICDGVADCPSGDDEDNCILLSCPGMLKCKLEKICIRSNEQCDGYAHCSLSGDDELHCDLPPCPNSCSCFRLALMCSSVRMARVPDYHPETKAMHFYNTSFSLTDKSFITYMALNRLLLSGVNLKMIPDGIFKMQKELMCMCLPNNSIMHLQASPMNALA